MSLTTPVQSVDRSYDGLGSTNASTNIGAGTSAVIRVIGSVVEPSFIRSVFYWIGGIFGKIGDVLKPIGSAIVAVADSIGLITFFSTTYKFLTKTIPNRISQIHQAPAVQKIIKFCVEILDFVQASLFFLRTFSKMIVQFLSKGVSTVFRAIGFILGVVTSLTHMIMQGIKVFTTNITSEKFKRAILKFLATIGSFAFNVLLFLGDVLGVLIHPVVFIVIGSFKFIMQLVKTIYCAIVKKPKN